MTKEKIIDGVDVAGCKYYNAVVNEESYCNIDEEHLYTCSSDTNCYYKQSKRLEQENERLKEELKIKENISEDFRKKALEWAEIANNYFKENSRLYKVLQEIKEIAEQILNKNEFVYMNYRDVRQIIRLITKTEEE